MSTRKKWNDIRAERVSHIPDADGAVIEAQLRMDLAQFVYDLREAARITQKALAFRMVTTQSAIARLEGGGTNPTAQLLQRLGQALSVRLVLTAEGIGSAVPTVVISGFVSTLLRNDK